MFGLHPEFEPVLPLWQSGKFGAVQAVGMRVPNRSHFAAMEAVEDADAGSSARVGWLNRMIGADARRRAAGGHAARRHHAADGAGRPGLGRVGPAAADFRLPGGDEDAAQDRMRSALTTLWGEQGSATGKAARAALEVSATMTSLAKDAEPANGAKYPDGDLGRALAAGPG